MHATIMRRSSVLAVSVALAACGANAKFAGLSMGPRRVELVERILTRTLPNGLRVVVLPDARTNLVTVGVRYAVGGADDPSAESGLAHYVEHVMYDAAFHGTSGRVLRDIALEENAMTTLDRTFFYATTLDTDTDRALEIAARRFETSCDDLDAATLARERDVVIEEVKQRSSYRWQGDELGSALWGASHPYAKGPGGAGFADIAKPALCEFIERHYGPGSAVLVVTGNVGDDALDRISARFERIPARAVAKRPQAHAPSRALRRLVLRGLERPTVIMSFAVPGEGTQADAAIDLLHGQEWWLGASSPARFATTYVVGEERERAVVAIAEVDDITKFDALEKAMRKTFTKPNLLNFERNRQHRRLALVSDLDDIFAAGLQLADLTARGERPTRFRDLRQLDDLTDAKVARMLDVANSRVAYLLPEVGVPGTHRASELATALHHLDVPRSPVAADAAPPTLPPQRPRSPVVEQRLANGMRVWLSPDPHAVAVDARLVIKGTQSAHLEVASWAAAFLDPRDGSKEGWEGLERVRWYRQIGVPVRAHADAQATTFRISGFALFGDWHVWHLAWTVLHGHYPAWIDRRRSESDTRPEDAQQPSARSIVSRRLHGTTDATTQQRNQPTTEELEAFRRSSYRPEASTLIVTGKFELAAMQKEIETLFGGWRASTHAVTSASPALPRPRTPIAIGIPADDAASVQIAIAFARQTESTAAERAAHAVLEAVLSDRLRVVREGLGASYGVHASVDAMAVRIHGDVEPTHAADAAKAVAVELERVRAGDATLADDFIRARRRVLARHLAQPSGAGTRAAELARLAADGRSFNQTDATLEAVRAMDLATLRRIAARDLVPARMIVAMRGKRPAVEAALAVFGIEGGRVEWLPRAPAQGR